MSDIVKGLLVILFLVILVLIPNIKIVQINRAYIVERLGRFLKIIDRPGVYLLIPLLDRVIQVVPLDVSDKILTLHQKESEITIKLTIRYQIENVKLFVYASLDSFHTIKEYIETLDVFSGSLSDEQIIEITEYAKQFGLEIIQIQNI